jgi:hypothetical protein
MMEQEILIGWISDAVLLGDNERAMKLSLLFSLLVGC